MAGNNEVVYAQLAVRIPKNLHRAIRMHCVTTGSSIMAFVAAAIEEKLRQPGDASRKSKRRSLAAR